MKRRIVTTLLAAALTAAMAMPAMATQGEGVATQSQANGDPEVEAYTTVDHPMQYAAQTPAAGQPVAVQDYVSQPTTSGTNTVTSINTAGNGSMNTVLNGTIQATQLKVTVPARIFFILDPTYQNETGLNGHMTQAVQPDIYITNESLVPVYAKITKVEMEQSQGNDKPSTGVLTPMSLINDVGQVYGTKRVMFGFREKGAITTWTKKSDWLMVCNDQEAWKNTQTGLAASEKGPYLLTNDRGRIEGLTYTNGDRTKPVADKLDMKIYIRTTAGWHVQDSFTITPTIVISVLDYTATTSQTTLASTEESTPVVMEEEMISEPSAEEQEELLAEEPDTPAGPQVDPPQNEVPLG